MFLQEVRMVSSFANIFAITLAGSQLTHAIIFERAKIWQAFQSVENWASRTLRKKVGKNKILKIGFTSQYSKQKANRLN
jgi:hypothetical protein